MPKSKSNKCLTRISLHIPDPHLKALKRISQDEDLNVSQIIRRALELYLSTQRQYIDLQDDELQLDAHLSETRTKKALMLSHIDYLEKAKKGFKDEGSLFDNDDLFEELNPDAF